MNIKNPLTQIAVAIVAFIYLTIISLFVKKVKKNLRYKKSVEALGWKVEYVHHPLVARFIKR